MLLKCAQKLAFAHKIGNCGISDGPWRHYMPKDVEKEIRIVTDTRLCLIWTFYKWTDPTCCIFLCLSVVWVLYQWSGLQDAFQLKRLHSFLIRGILYSNAANEWQNSERFVGRDQDKDVADDGELMEVVACSIAGQLYVYTNSFAVFVGQLLGPLF